MAKFDVQYSQVKPSVKERMLSPFKKAWQAVKDFFYDASVNIHNTFCDMTGIKKRTKVRSQKSYKIGESIFVWGLLAYPLLQFLVFYVGVNLNSILLSFQEYEIIDVGGGVWRESWSWLSGEHFFDNFKRFFEEMSTLPSMGIIVSNSLIAYAVSTLIGLPLNLVFAYIIYKKVPCSAFFQVMLYLPQMVSSVVISLMFSKFISSSFPMLINDVLNLDEIFGFEPIAKDLMANPATGFGMNLFYSLWAGFGSQLILYAGAMSRIPDSLIEFGELEGITLFKEFFHVVIPMVYSTITVFLVTGIASIFTNQLALYNFYAGGAAPAFRTLGYEFYVMVLNDSKQDYPYASAAGLIFTLIVAPITLVGRHLLEKYGPTVEF